MLVTSDRLLISEVRGLEAEEGATDIDTLLFQLSASEEYAAAGARGADGGRQQGQQGRERTPEDLQGGCARHQAPGLPVRAPAVPVMPGGSAM